MLRAKDDKERKAIINQIDKVYNSTEGITIKEACAAVGVSDRTYYNWRNRLQQDSTKTVSEQVPTSSPNTATGSDVEQKVVNLKKAKPFLGFTKISKQINYTYGIRISPGKVRKILIKHGLDKSNYSAPKKQHQPRRFERLSRNELWMMDIMYYRLKKEGRFYLIRSI